MNISESRRAWIRSALMLFLAVATYGLAACDDSNNGPGCGSVPADGRFLTFSADADFSIIGNFNWPPTQCTCIAVN